MRYTKLLTQPGRTQDVLKYTKNYFNFLVCQSQYENAIKYFVSHNRFIFSRFWFARLLRHHFSHHVRAKESPAQRHREGGNLLGRPGKGNNELSKQGGSFSGLNPCLSNSILTTTFRLFCNNFSSVIALYFICNALYIEIILKYTCNSNIKN